MNFIKQQKYNVSIFFENWMNRKVIETENRELTLIETTMLIIGYSIWTITK